VLAHARATDANAHSSFGPHYTASVGFLKRLFGKSDAVAPTTHHVRTAEFVPTPHERHPTPPFVNRRGAPLADGVKLKGKGRVGVVGERSYEPALVAVTCGRTELGVNVGVLAALVPEPDNPYDPRAVAVQVDGQTLGYLSKSDAKAYGAVLEKVTADGKLAFCNATIRGGWDRGGEDRGDFGVTLDLARPEEALPG